jgi:hypothetical protein
MVSGSDYLVPNVYVEMAADPHVGIRSVSLDGLDDEPLRPIGVGRPVRFTGWTLFHQ